MNAHKQPCTLHARARTAVERFITEMETEAARLAANKEQHAANDINAVINATRNAANLRLRDFPATKR